MSDPNHLACRDAVELVTDYLEGALSPEALSIFEEHVALCDGCASHLDNLRRLSGATRALAVDDLDPAVLDKLTAALRLAQQGS